MKKKESKESIDQEMVAAVYAITAVLTIALFVVAFFAFFIVTIFSYHQEIKNPEAATSGQKQISNNL